MQEGSSGWGAWLSAGAWEGQDMPGGPTEGSPGVKEIKLVWEGGSPSHKCPGLLETSLDPICLLYSLVVLVDMTLTVQTIL